MSLERASASNARFRPLLPAGTRQTVSDWKPPPRSNRKPVSAACNACRRLKLKCSGDRPACRSCAQRRVECSYTTKPGETERQARNRQHRDLQQRSSTSEHLLKLLVELPPEDAQSVLQRLRDGADIANVITQINECDLLLQLNVTPETRFRYDFPYKAEMPEDCLIDNPYLDSLLYEASSLFVTGNSKQETTNRIAALSTTEQQDLYLKPFHAAEIVDPRLSGVKISTWTSVCDDNVLMRDILSWWLRCEYQFTAAFQKDLFLEDMAVGRGDFCSPLLVNIMLGYACVCYPRLANRARYWDSNSLMYRFVAEARRLWELEAHIPHITTIQAGILFNVYYNLCGLDEVGQKYRTQAISLAHDLRLFDDSIKQANERTRRGRIFAAWALFNWETLVGFSFTFAPLLVRPPPWPLPDPLEEPDWYGEIWCKYPLATQRVPINFGHVFRARSQFRVIMNEACQVAYSAKSEIDLAKARTLLARLQDWYFALPDPLQPRFIALPGHLQLHMYYHHLILSIFEPLLGLSDNQAPAPDQIVGDARKHLQTLVRLYYLRHGYEAMDLFIVIPLMLIASDCIDAIHDQTQPDKLETLRSTLLLVAKGLHNQRRNHYLANALFRVVQGRMRPSDVALFRGILNLNEDELDDKVDMAQAVRSHWPVSVVKNKGERDALILTNLVENYAHLNIGGENMRNSASSESAGQADIVA